MTADRIQFYIQIWWLIITVAGLLIVVGTYMVRYDLPKKLIEANQKSDLMTLEREPYHWPIRLLEAHKDWQEEQFPSNENIRLFVKSLTSYPLKNELQKFSSRMVSKLCSGQRNMYSARIIAGFIRIMGEHSKHPYKMVKFKFQ